MQAFPTPPQSWTVSQRALAHATPGSHARSWSQSSQRSGREGLASARHEPLSSRTHHVSSLQRLQERGNRSPRPQTSRPGRAPSYTQLHQPLGSCSAAAAAITISTTPTTVAATVASAIPLGVPGQAVVSSGLRPGQIASGDGQDEAQMNNLRTSLLQHIQSVQKEISRLQHERQRAQQTQHDRLPQFQDSSGPVVTAAPPPQITTSSGSTVAALVSPHSSTRQFSSERERPTQGTDRFRRPSSRREGGATSLTASASMRARATSPGSHQATTSSSLAVAATAAAAPSHLTLTTAAAPTLATAMRAVARQEPRHQQEKQEKPEKPERPEPRSPQATAGEERELRSPHGKEVVNGGSTQAPVAIASSGQTIRSTAAAATAARNIQRAWRRRVTKRRTGSKRASRASRGSTAPRQAHGGRSPPGGTATTGNAPASAVAPGREPPLPQPRPQQPAVPQPDISSSPSRTLSHSATNGYLKGAPVQFAATRIQRAWKLNRWRHCFTDFSENQVRWVGSLEWLQHHNLLYGTELADNEDVRWWLHHRATAALDREVDPWGSEKLLEHLSRMWYGASRAELQEQQRLAEQQKLAEQQAQMQHRSESDTSRRHRHEQRNADDIYGAFSSAQDPAIAAAMTSACGSTSGRSATARSRLTGSHNSPQLRAVASAERSVGHRQVSMASVSSATGKATSLSPRHEAAAAAAWVGGDGSGRSSKGAIFGAPPPTSAAGYQKNQPNYRVASHSPPQTSRAPRPSVSSGPVVVSSVSLRPRSPAQSARGGPLASQSQSRQPPTRLSLPSSASMQTRLGQQVQRHSSGATRAVSGSPPPSLVRTAHAAVMVAAVTPMATAR